MDTTGLHVFNFYNSLNSDEKFDFRTNNYTSMIVSFLCRMFTIDGLTESQKNVLLTKIYTNGTCLLKRDGDSFIICEGNFYGVPKVNEIYPRRYIAVKATDGASAFRYDSDVVEDETATVCYVNNFLAPVTEIQRFAVQLADTDTSMVNNIKYCRIAPIGVVQNDKERKSYETALDKMLKGELVNSVKSDLDLSGNMVNLTTIDISNGNYSDKLQYLSMYHEQLLSRLCKLFGISYNMISKNANVTNDELDSVDVFASVLPSSMKDILNECLEKLGLKADFTAPWKWIDSIYEIKMDGLQETTTAEDNNGDSPTNNEDSPANESEGENE